MRTFFKETTLQRQIEATDRQIDALVYELYGPTEDARVVATDSLHRSDRDIEGLRKEGDRRGEVQFPYLV
jgi:hypothetical protein